MLFKVTEREELIARIAELEERNAQWKKRVTQSEARNAELKWRAAVLAALEQGGAKFAELERRVAELESRDAEKTARNAELENEKRQPPDEEEQQ